MRDSLALCGGRYAFLEKLSCRHVEHLLCQQLLQLGVLIRRYAPHSSVFNRLASDTVIPEYFAFQAETRAFRHSMLAAQISALRAVDVYVDRAPARSR